MLDTAALSDDIEALLDRIRDAAAEEALGDALGIVGDRLTTATATLLMEIQRVRDAVTGVLDGAGAPSGDEALQQLAAELSGVDGVTATFDPTEDVIRIELDAVREIDLGGGALSEDLDLPLGGLRFDGSLDLDAVLALDVTLDADTRTGELELVADAGTELTLAVEGDVAVDAEADGALGFLSGSVEEIDEDGRPDIDLRFAVDLTGDDAPPELRLDGRTAVTVRVETDPPEFEVGSLTVPVLPAAAGDITLAFDYPDIDLSEPDAAREAFSLRVEDLRLEFGSLARVLDGVLEKLDGVLSIFPLEPIIRIMLARLPVIDDLAPKATFDLDGSGEITLRDLVEFATQFLPDNNPALGFLDAVLNLVQLREAVGQLAETGGSLNLGSISVGGGTLATVADGGSVPEESFFSGPSDLAALEDLAAALQGLAAFVGGDVAAEAALLASTAPAGIAAAFEPSVAAAAQASAEPVPEEEGALEFPLFESVESVVSGVASILLNGFGAPPVTIVEYTLPLLEFEASKQFDFPFNPFFAFIEGVFEAQARFAVGYDTSGLSLDGVDFARGLYLRGALDEVTVPDGDGGTVEKAPIASVALGLNAGGGVDFGVASASVGGGVLGEIFAFLGGSSPGSVGGSKSYLEEVADCFIDDIGGRVSAQLFGELTFGFGPFEIELRQVFGQFVLAQFNVDPCPPGHGSGTHVDPTEVFEGLAVQGPDPENGDTLFLATGPLTPMRNLPEGVDVDFDGVSQAMSEVFVVGRPPESVTGEPAPAGEIAVRAFGVHQRFGGDGAPPLDRVEARGDMGDDDIRVLAETGLAADLFGGIGDDLLSGGDRADTLDGGYDNDILIGNGGDDELLGGGGSDSLDGGAGADAIDGGEGNDKVDYSSSEVAVTIAYDAADDVLRGQGGDAEGDVITGVEHIVGSAQGDVLTGSQVQGNILDGRDGDDELRGGEEGDLLLGGRGADLLVGDDDGDDTSGEDRTTYAFSRAGVFIDLQSGTAQGGDAQGDQFVGIEHFQLSGHDDTFRGDAADNEIEGLNGDDVLDGRSGADTVRGQGGDDRITGGLEGDVLDGGGPINVGAGRDVADYSLAGTAVELSMTDGAGGDGHALALGGGAQERDVLIGAQVSVPLPDGGEELRYANEFGASDRSSFEDVVTGSGDDAIVGDSGDNRIEAREGDDTIEGGFGDDTLLGGAGSDDLDGGQGEDWADYSGATGMVEVDLDAGAGTAGEADGDTLTEIENLRGTVASDVLRGDAGRNVIDPGLIDAFATEEVDGRGGLDTLWLDYAGSLVTDAVRLVLDDAGDGEAEVDSALGLPTAEMTVRSMEQLRVVTGSGDDVVETGVVGADDLANLGGGDDAISAGLGVDRIYLGGGDDEAVRLGDVTRFGEGPLYGTGFTDSKAETFVLNGAEGIDALTLDLSFETADRTLVWEAPTADGDQAIRTDAGGVALNFEVLRGLIAGSGDDVLGQVGEVDSTIYARAGADTVIAGLGFDRMFGGESNGSAGEDVDTLVVDYSVTGRSDVSMRGGTPNLVYDLVEDGTGTVLASVSHRDFERFEITGTLGDDTIDAGDGDDLIDGRGGSDEMRGGEGADRFVLGDAAGLFYGGGGLAATDFRASEGDVLVLSGRASDYVVVGAGPGFGDAGYVALRGPDGEAAELIAFVLEADALDLEGASVEYVGSAAADTAAAPEPAATDLLDETLDLGAVSWLHDEGLVDARAVIDAAARSEAEAPAASAAPGDVQAGLAPADMGRLLFDSLDRQFDLLEPTVPDVPFLDPYFDGTVELEGSADAVGRHRDVFGGPGVVVSNGQAEQIPGANADDGAGSPGAGQGATDPLDFATVGTVRISGQDVTLYRAELPDVPGGIASLTLTDANTPFGGAPGRDSGFDLEGVAISDRLVTDVAPSLAGIAAQLAPDDPLLGGVFDFSQQGVFFEAGDARPTANPALQGPLAGTANGLVDFARADLRPGTGLSDYLSLGDGGSIGFNLDAPVDSSEAAPRYLYVTELGTPEDIDGLIAASSEPIGPQGDLSTDLGLPGMEDDETVLRYSFDASRYADVLPSGEPVDLFEVVLVSEEIPERAFRALQDHVSIRVNGLEALTFEDGLPVSLNELTVPFDGRRDPSLFTTLVGEGGMADAIRADGHTTAFRVSAPIDTGGANLIEITVADGGDALLDTALFLSPISRLLVEGTEGEDGIEAPEGDTAVEIGGLGGDDEIRGSERGDLLRGGEGADRIEGEGGADEIRGGDGLDEAQGGGGADRIEGGRDADILEGGGGDDRLWGGFAAGPADDYGADTLLGGAGDDALFGQNGDDTLDGGAGSDEIDGGAGLDTALYDAAAFAEGGVVAVDGGFEVADGTGGTDRLRGVERLLFLGAGAGGADVEVELPQPFLGFGLDAGADLGPVAFDDEARLSASVVRGAVTVGGLRGDLDVLANDIDLDGEGAKRVTQVGAEGGPASVIPSDGAPEAVEGAHGTLTLRADGTFDYAPDPEALAPLADGSRAVDRFTYRAGDGGPGGSEATLEIVVVKQGRAASASVPEPDDPSVGTPGADVMEGTPGDDALRARGGDDVVKGGPGDDLMSGGAGDDALRGGRGDDRLLGGDGSDDLRGGIGADRLLGGAGDDRLDGGRGAGIDRATGGDGADVFVFAAGDARLVVTDFDFEEGDRIDLVGVSADGRSHIVAGGEQEQLIVLENGDSILFRGEGVDLSDAAFV